MFLSMIVPVYNAGVYLEECLHSLLAQDVADYEIICVDDGSTDGSGAILDEFAQRFRSVRPIHQSNGGVVAARNAGLAAARGEYIWFVDADDFVCPNILARLRSVIEDSRCDQLVFGGFQFADAMTPEQEALRASGALPDNVPGPGAVVWRSLIRRAFLEEHGVSFRYPELTHGEDGQFMYELSMESPACTEIPDTVYFYRIRSGSAETDVSGENRRRKLRSHIAIVKIMAKQYAGNAEDTATANRLMTMLWTSLYGAAKLPRLEARQVLATLGDAGVYPFSRPNACTLTKSYMTNREDIIGKGFDWLYRHLHTRWGFALMWMLCHLAPGRSGC